MFNGCAEPSRSRDSLLVAMTTLMWGCCDAEMAGLVCRLVYDSLTRQDKASRLVERSLSFHQSDAVVAHELTRHSGNDATRINNAQASGHSATHSDHLLLPYILHFTSV